MFFIRFVLFCTDSINDFMSKNCPYIAAAISFYALFAIFPLSLAIMTLMILLGFGSEQGKVDLAKSIAEVLPVSSEFIADRIGDVARDTAITGILGALGLLWAATAAFAAIRKGINAAWGIRKPRPFIKERLIDFALVLGAGIIMLSILYSGPSLAVARQILEVMAPESTTLNNFLWNFLAKLLSPAASFLAFLVMYRFLPNTQVRLQDVWPPALLASLAFEGVKWGFVTYVSTAVPYNQVYGSVGAIIALLTWVYLSALIVLFGALVSSQYAAYSASFGSEKPGLKVLWTGLWRVRIRLVTPAAAG